MIGARRQAISSDLSLHSPLLPLLRVLRPGTAVRVITAGSSRVIGSLVRQILQVLLVFAQTSLDRSDFSFVLSKGRRAPVKLGLIFNLKLAHAVRESCLGRTSRR